MINASMHSLPSLLMVQTDIHLQHKMSLKCKGDTHTQLSFQRNALSLYSFPVCSCGFYLSFIYKPAENIQTIFGKIVALVILSSRTK